MPTLIFMRHAKSSWDDPSLDDFDRPLNDRGREAAPQMANWYIQQGLVPDAVLCSASTRTRETLGLMLETWQNKAKQNGAAPEVAYEELLYHASPDMLIAAAASEPDAETVMVLAHNPSLESLANRFCQELGVDRSGSLWVDHMPTASAFIVEGEWQNDSFAAKQAVAFVQPRNLG